MYTHPSATNFAYFLLKLAVSKTK